MNICTVAIPVYNRRDLVQRALQSALAQDIDDLDILVVDNCSDDGTWEALSAYHDSRLRLVRNERNVGLFGNFNRCLELARGRYLRFLCSDDQLAPGCLRREVALMEQLPSAVLLSGRGRLVDESGQVLGSQAAIFGPGIYDGLEALGTTIWCQLHYGKNPLNYPSGVLLRSEAARHAGLFDTNLRVVGDLDFFFRVLLRGDLAIIDDINCEIMVHPHQEGSGPFADGTLVREFDLLIQRFAEQIGPSTTPATLQRQLPGWCLWLAIKWLREGSIEASRLHLSIARQLSIRPWDAPVALGRIVGLRLLAQAYRLHFLPFRALDRNPQLI